MSLGSSGRRDQEGGAAGLRGRGLDLCAYIGKPRCPQQCGQPTGGEPATSVPHLLTESFAVMLEKIGHDQAAPSTQNSSCLAQDAAGIIEIPDELAIDLGLRGGSS